MVYLNEQTKQELTELCQKHDITLLWDEPMKLHTTFKIGGPAAAMAVPQNREQVKQIVTFAKEKSLPLWYLGNGSNLLVSDEGLDGIVVLLEASFEGEIIVEGNTLEVPAGKRLSAVCAAALEHELSGMEFAWGIPGSVGGGVYMNAGAYGGEIKDCLSWVEYLAADGSFVRKQAQELSLSYRHSIFMEQEFEDVCILRAAFTLKKGNREEIKAQMDDVLHKRKEKQPLEYPSAGSTFKRPEGAFAAKLIEDCGLKGKSVGGAQVSEKHAGFVINRGNASCQDVLTLCRQVADCVKEQSGYELHMEIRCLP